MSYPRIILHPPPSPSSATPAPPATPPPISHLSPSPRRRAGTGASASASGNAWSAGPGADTLRSLQLLRPATRVQAPRATPLRAPTVRWGRGGGLDVSELDRHDVEASPALQVDRPLDLDVAAVEREEELHFRRRLELAGQIGLAAALRTLDRAATRTRRSVLGASAQSPALAGLGGAAGAAAQPRPVDPRLLSPLQRHLLMYPSTQQDDDAEDVLMDDGGADAPDDRDGERKLGDREADGGGGTDAEGGDGGEGGGEERAVGGGVEGGEERVVGTWRPTLVLPVAVSQSLPFPTPREQNLIDFMDESMAFIASKVHSNKRVKQVQRRALAHGALLGRSAIIRAKALEAPSQPAAEDDANNPHSSSASNSSAVRPTTSSPLQRNRSLRTVQRTPVLPLPPISAADLARDSALIRNAAAAAATASRPHAKKPPSSTTLPSASSPPSLSPRGRAAGDAAAASLSAGMSAEGSERVAAAMAQHLAEVERYTSAFSFAPFSSP
jgi:hypothetical protein